MGCQWREVNMIMLALMPIQMAFAIIVRTFFSFPNPFGLLRVELKKDSHTTNRGATRLP